MDRAKLESALRNADAAGDTVAAKQLANALKAMSAQPEQTMKAPQANEGRDGQGIFEKIDAGVRGAADMATFGFADEISAGLGTGFGFLGDYDKELARQRGIDAFDAEKNSGARLTGQIAGGVGTGLGLAKNGATLLTKQALKQGGKQAVARAGAEGAAYGGAYGFGSGDNAEERLSQAGTGALTGAIAGAGVQKVGNALASRSMAKQAAKSTPSTANLGDEAALLYAKADQAGVMIKAPAFDRALTNMNLAAGRVNEKLQPKTAAILEYIGDLKGRNVSLSEMDELRQVVGQTLKRAEPQDARLLQRMKTTLDAFAEKQINPSDITGDIKGFKFIKQAREVYSRKAKSQVMDDIIEKAKNQATGFENGLVVQFRQLANNPKRLKQFSAEEQKLIKDVVRRGGARAILRTMGMLSPTSTFGGISMGAVGAGTGVIPAAIMGGVGYGSRKGAEAMTRNVSDKAINAIRSGNAAQMQPVNSAIAARIAPASGALAAEQLLPLLAPQDRPMQRQKVR